MSLNRNKQDPEQLRTKRQARRLGRRKALSGVRKWQRELAAQALLDKQHRDQAWKNWMLAPPGECSPRRKLKVGDVWQAGASIYSTMRNLAEHTSDLPRTFIGVSDNITES